MSVVNGRASVSDLQDEVVCFDLGDGEIISGILVDKWEGFFVVQGEKSNEAFLINMRDVRIAFKRPDAEVANDD